jgi:hypothetical protein
MRRGDADALATVMTAFTEERPLRGVVHTAAYSTMAC